MGLEKTFKDLKKPPLEKKLEVITSKNSTTDELIAYFEKNKYEGVKFWDENKEYFGSCMDSLKSLELTPEIITELNTKIRSEYAERESLGIYLSALMQTSYNQGHNNFTFEKINADCFGAFLQGQLQNPIKITTKDIFATFSLWFAEYCALTTQKLNGTHHLHRAKNCSLTAETIKGTNNLSETKNCTLKAENIEGNSLEWSDGCIAEITNYQGTGFGYGMKNGIIKSKNEKTLELIRKTVGIRRNNKFELIK